MTLNNQMQIIILYGPPCAGKSALATKLCKEYNYKLISTDLLRVNYFDELKELYQPNNVSIIYNMLFERIEKNIKLNKSVIIEGMFLSLLNKERIFNFESFCDIKFAFVTASYEVLLERLLLRNKKNSNNILQHQAPLSADSLFDFYKRCIPPNNEDFIINTSDTNIDTSYDKLLSIVDSQYSIQSLKNSVLNNGN
jgi:predicted kinase